MRSPQQLCPQRRLLPHRCCAGASPPEVEGGARQQVRAGHRGTPCGGVQRCGWAAVGRYQLKGVQRVSQSVGHPGVQRSQWLPRVELALASGVGGWVGMGASAQGNCQVDVSSRQGRCSCSRDLQGEKSPPPSPVPTCRLTPSGKRTRTVACVCADRSGKLRSLSRMAACLFVCLFCVCGGGRGLHKIRGEQGVKLAEDA